MKKLLCQEAGKLERLKVYLHRQPSNFPASSMMLGSAKRFSELFSLA
jgi:hypothetical protein